MGVVDRNASDYLVVIKLIGTPREPRIDPDVEQQIARFRRPGFKDPREKEYRAADAGLYGRSHHQVLIGSRLKSVTRKTLLNMAGISASRSAGLCAMSFSRVRCSSTLARSSPPS